MTKAATRDPTDVTAAQKAVQTVAGKVALPRPVASLPRPEDLPPPEVWQDSGIHSDIAEGSWALCGYGQTKDGFDRRAQSAGDKNERQDDDE